MTRILSIATLVVALFLALPASTATAKPGKGKGKSEAAKEMRGKEQPGPAAGVDETDTPPAAEMPSDAPVDDAPAAMEAGEDAASRGSGKSAEAHERNAARSAAKADYDAAVEGGAERVKGKKPWWKIWGD